MIDRITDCSCPLAGYCERHKTRKTPHMHMLCATRPQYFALWEGGKGPGQQVQIAPRTPPVATPPKLLGDQIESLLATFGITKDRVEEWVGGPCGCTERQQKLNALGEWAASAADRGKAWGLARLREIGALS